jgi:osmotically-inducible protein OsmY
MTTARETSPRMVRQRAGNHLVQSPEVPHVCTDAEMAGAAIRALDAENAVPSGRVHVRVHDGWVVLEGMVDHYYQRLAAEDAVLDLDCDPGIENHITVKPRNKL